MALASSNNPTVHTQILPHSPSTDSHLLQTPTSFTCAKCMSQCVPYLMTMLDACEKCKPIVTELTEGDELATYKLIEESAVKLFYAADQ